MKKILVTGGTGFIGSHTVAELAAVSFQPLLVDNFSNSNADVLNGLAAIIGKTVPCHVIDCTDREQMRTIFEKERPDGIIHFAAYKAVNESVEYPLKYYHNNLVSLIVLLELMYEFGVRNIVFSSSCTVYGQPDHNPVTELSELKKTASPYGYTKQVCEQMLFDAQKANPELNVAILRYFNPIGAHPTGLIGELPRGVPNNLIPFITQTAAGLWPSLSVFGNDYNTADGTCIRDYIHVVDLASAHVKALQWLEHQSGVCDVFNLGQGKGNSVMEVIQAFEEVTGQKLNYKICPRRPGDVEQVWADVSKAEKILGWKTEQTLSDALRDAWQWQQKLSAHS